jgi:Tol biopolymer transport system component
VNPDGSVRSTVEGAAQIPRFSADGRMIAYEGSGPPEKGMQDTFGIVVRSAEGNNDLVSFMPDFYDDETWSPDGRWFADSTGLDPAPYTDSCVGDLAKTEILPFP